MTKESHSYNITCVVPCYNSGDTIKRAVQSLLNQELQPDEIIIVNDGSDLECVEILEQLQKENEIVRIVHQSNKGLPSARNLGIQESKGNYLLMLDADDTFEPSFLGKALDLIYSDPKVAVVTCGVARIINDTVKYTYVPTKLDLRDCLLDNIAPACALFRKEALTTVRGYDSSFTSGYEDWDLNIRLLENKFKFQVIPEILFNYYDTEGSLLKETQSKELLLRKKILQKHHTLYAQNLDIFIDEIDQCKKRTGMEVSKSKRSIDYRIGSSLLKPFRWIKHFLT